jgi:hypothetical protein
VDELLLLGSAVLGLLLGALAVSVNGTAGHQRETEFPTKPGLFCDRPTSDSALRPACCAAQHAQARAEQDRADELLHKEIDHADRFRAHVLQSRSSAMAYWATRHREILNPEALGEIKRMIDDMIDEERRLEPWQEVAQIVSTFVANLDVATKRTLLETLARYIDQFSDGLAGEWLRAIAAALPD